MFKLIFFIGLWIGVYCGKGRSPTHGKLEGYGKETEKGICLNPEKILHYCMAGTIIGEKMQVAIEKCSKQCGNHNNHVKPGKGLGKGKGKGKGNGKGKGKGSKGKGGKGKGTGKNNGGIIFECPKIDDIKEKFKEAHSEQFCIFREMGWLVADSLDGDKEAIKADISQLPSSVFPRLSCARTDQCAKTLMMKETDCPKTQEMIRKCEDNYSLQDKAEILKIKFATAKIACFMGEMGRACGDHVRCSIMTLFSGGKSVDCDEDKLGHGGHGGNNQSHGGGHGGPGSHGGPGGKQGGGKGGSWRP